MRYAKLPHPFGSLGRLNARFFHKSCPDAGPPESVLTAAEPSEAISKALGISADGDVPLTFLDMGNWAFPDFMGSEMGENTPGSAALAGIQIMQMLPAGLLARAQHFGAFPGGQVRILPLTSTTKSPRLPMNNIAFAGG